MTHTEKYLEWLKYGRRLSDNTIIAISNDFKHFGDGLENATRSDVEMWVMKMNKDDLSTATVARRLSSISGFFEWQIYNELRNGSNPAKGKIAPKIRHEETKKLTRKQLDELYDSASIEVKYAVALMGYAGLRIGEVVSIKDMYLDATGTLAVYLEETKNDRPRHVSLALLPEPELIGKIYRNGGLKGQRGKLSSNAIWRRCRVHFDNMGYHKLTPHGLRATYSAILSEANINPNIIRTSLGHTSHDELGAITARYIGEASVEQQAQALEAIR